MLASIRFPCLVILTLAPCCYWQLAVCCTFCMLAPCFLPPYHEPPPLPPPPPVETAISFHGMVLVATVCPKFLWSKVIVIDVVCTMCVCSKQAEHFFAFVAAASVLSYCYMFRTPGYFTLSVSVLITSIPCCSQFRHLPDPNLEHMCIAPGSLIGLAVCCNNSRQSNTAASTNPLLMCCLDVMSSFNNGCCTGQNSHSKSRLTLQLIGLVYGFLLIRRLTTW